MNEKQNQLIQDNIELASYLASSFKRRVPRHITHDELKSAAYLGLVKAAKKYDESRDVAFEKYASTMMYFEILDFLQERRWGNKRKNTPISNMVSINAQGRKEKSILDFCMGDSDIDFSHTNDIFQSFKKYVSERELSFLVDYYVNEKNMTEMSKEHGISGSRMQQIIDRARNKIRKRFEVDSNQRGYLAYEVLNEQR